MSGKVIDVFLITADIACEWREWERVERWEGGEQIASGAWESGGKMEQFVGSAVTPASARRHEPQTCNTELSDITWKLGFWNKKQILPWTAWTWKCGALRSTETSLAIDPLTLAYHPPRHKCALVQNVWSQSLFFIWVHPRDSISPCDWDLTGDLHWKILLHVVYAIATKVNKCLWTDCNIQGDLIKKNLKKIWVQKNLSGSLFWATWIHSISSHIYFCNIYSGITITTTHWSIKHSPLSRFPALL